MGSTGAIGCAVACLLLAMSPEAGADEADAREHARALATEGDHVFARGRCDQAIALWTQADAAYHAPTIVLRVARCEALLGRVVHAAAALESILAERPSAADSDAFQLARADAARELPVIQARVAHVVVVVDGARTDDARVELDGHPVPVGVAAPVDPGPHEIRVVSASSEWSRRERVADGEARTVHVGVVPRASAEGRSAGRTLGFVLGGAGMASMAVGAGFGAVSVAVSHQLFGACGAQGSACPPAEQPRIDALKRDAFVSDLTLGIGAAFFLSGAIVLVTEKLTRPEKTLQFDLVGTGVMVRGGF